MISISKLGELAYCEYKIYFREWLKKHKIKPKVTVTKEIIEGIKAHKELKDNHIEIDTKDLEHKRELSVRGNSLSGRMDELIKTPDFIKIIDDKPHDTIYNGDKWQVYGYCLAYSEQHEDEIEDRKIIGAVRNWKTKNIIWEEEFTDTQRDFIKDKVQRMEGIIDGTITAQSTDNPFKCKKCNLKKQCDKSLYREELDIRKLIKGEK